MMAIRSTMVYRTIFAVAAAINLLVFLTDGFDIDKLVIAILFLTASLAEGAMEGYRKSSRVLNEIIDRQTDLIAKQRQAMGDKS